MIKIQRIYKLCNLMIRTSIYRLYWENKLENDWNRREK